MRHSHHHSSFTTRCLAGGRTRSVAVCIPARDEEATIGAVVGTVLGLVEAGVVDRVLVVDGSCDGTAAAAAAAGAEVVAESALLPELGPALGKGDAMWRALSVLHEDVVAYVDADTANFAPHFVTGVLGPLLTGTPARFVKGAFRRPLQLGGRVLPDGGGRVTELLARPALRQLFGELADLRQPLAGEIAADRELLEALSFTTGYGVDVGLLIDSWRLVGREAIAEVDLDWRQNDHQPLVDLARMADEVLDAILTRTEHDGRLAGGRRPGAGAVQRPPMATLRVAEAA